MNRKVTSVVLLLALFAMMCNVCYAADPRASELFAARSIEEAALGGGTVEFTARAFAYDVMDKLGFKIIRIQEYYEGSWSTVKTVYSRYGYGVGSYSYTVEYDGVAGRSYRVYVEYYAMDGTAWDLKTSSTTGMTAI